MERTRDEELETRSVVGECGKTLSTVADQRGEHHFLGVHELLRNEEWTHLSEESIEEL